MSHIKVLSQYTANQIAAGEVVERPASVVKELMENSIDAKSTSITVEIAGGGIEYIRVTDDGCGIGREDAETAFLRHATSKIANAEDLTYIETLGFRGEALASIAAVAHVVMRTAEHDAECGTLVRVNGGDVAESTETGCNSGTSIEVSDLFYNVPARLKFLKNPRSEAMFISDYVSRMILARPEIQIKFIQNGKTVFHSAGDGKLSSAIFCVYGNDVFPHIRELDYDDGYVALSGVIGTDEIARSNRTHQSFFINDRYIKSQKLSMAVYRAYDTRIMVGRFPFIVMKARINPMEIDVNVHPNKLDIRFKEEERVTRAATIATRMALGDPVAPIVTYREATPFKRVELENRETVVEAEKAVLVSRLADKPGPSQPAIDTAKKVPDSGTIHVPEPVADVAAELNSQEIFTHGKLNEAEPAKIVPALSVERPTPILIEQPRFTDTSYRVVGQLFDCYWLIEQGDSVFMVDQHAAHERILYEKYMSGTLRNDSQLLLIPTVVKLSPQEFLCVTENMDEFRELGFDIEEFGTLTISIRAVPHILGQPETKKFLYDAISALMANKRATGKELKRASIIQAACKHAIKAGERLPEDVIVELLTHYRDEGVPMTCPHGRPVMVVMTKTEFEKMFKRIV